MARARRAHKRKQNKPVSRPAEKPETGNVVTPGIAGSFLQLAKHGFTAALAAEAHNWTFAVNVGICSVWVIVVLWRGLLNEQTKICRIANASTEIGKHGLTALFTAHSHMWGPITHVVLCAGWFMTLLYMLKKTTETEGEASVSAVS